MDKQDSRPNSHLEPSNAQNDARDNAQGSTQGSASDNAQGKPPRFQKVVEGAYDLSLGISLIVAVALGYGIGYALKALTGVSWLLWLGIVWGVGAAFLNIYKAYKRHKKDLDELATNPRYNAQKYLQDSQSEQGGGTRARDLRDVRTQDDEDEDDPYAR